MRRYLDPRINVDFLVEQAGLGIEFGYQEANSEDPASVPILTFRDENLERVEDALRDYPELYLPIARAAYFEKLAARRRIAEAQGGPMGMPVDPATTLRFVCATVGCLMDPATTELEWEVQRAQFAEITNDQVKMAFVGAFRYQQACFKNVRRITGLLNAVSLAEPTLDALDAALAEMRSVDMETGWPEIQ